MSHLINNVAEGIEDLDDSLAISGVVMGDSIGYPKRIVISEGETHEGEKENFDQAYDYACSLFGVDEVGVEKEDKFVWFTDTS